MKRGCQRQLMMVSQNRAQPMPHLAGGFAGKGHRQDQVRGYPFLGDQMGDTRGQCTGFAGAGPGHDHQWAGGVLHRLTLVFIQLLKKACR